MVVHGERAHVLQQPGHPPEPTVLPMSSSARCCCLQGLSWKWPAPAPARAAGRPWCFRPADEGAATVKLVVAAMEVLEMEVLHSCTVYLWKGRGKKKSGVCR